MADLIDWLRRIFSGSGSSTATARPPHTPPVEVKRHQNLYRPLATTRTSARPAIQFRPGAGTRFLVDQDIKDLVDALTGAPLQPALGLYKCERCKLFYQSQSYQLLQRENSGRCVNCLLADEIKKVSDHREQTGRNADVSVATLDNYRQFMGHVITFEGAACKVLESSRGGDYAVMFEDKTWTRGFKVMVFRNDVERVGGAQLIKGLNGHLSTTIRNAHGDN